MLDVLLYFDYSGNMETKKAVDALAALAQETRLGVYRLLVQAGPAGLAAGQIGEQLGLPPATLSFHLAHLSRANLVRGRQDGRYIFYSVDFDQMNGLVEFLTENCCAGASCISAGCAPSIEHVAPPARRRAVSKA